MNFKGFKAKKNFDFKLKEEQWSSPWFGNYQFFIPVKGS